MNTYEVTVKGEERFTIQADYYETALEFVDFYVGDPLEGADTIASFKNDEIKRIIQKER